MSYDALVWLLVGLGIGVAASLMLLIAPIAVQLRFTCMADPRFRVHLQLMRNRSGAPVAGSSEANMATSALLLRAGSEAKSL